MLGQSGTKAVLQNINSRQNPGSREEFHRNLHQIFDEGSLVLEEAIIKKLFQRLKLRYEEKTNFDFPECVKHARQLYLT